MEATTTARARCPMCKVALDAERPGPHRPFCSERCKLLDLSRWLRGEYAIPGEPTGGAAADDDDDQEAW